MLAMQGPREKSSPGRIIEDRLSNMLDYWGVILYNVKVLAFRALLKPEPSQALALPVVADLLLNLEFY